MAEEFTLQERRLIALCLCTRPGMWERVMPYAAFILPSLLFAIYGIWKKDFVALIVAYLSLTIVAVLYVGYGRRNTEVLRSALHKYEKRVGVLTPVASTRI